MPKSMLSSCKFFAEPFLDNKEKIVTYALSATFVAAVGGFINAMLLAETREEGYLIIILTGVFVGLTQILHTLKKIHTTLKQSLPNQEIEGQ